MINKLDAGRVYEQAGTLLASGDPQGAIRMYRLCMTLVTPDASLCNNLGVALLRVGEYSEAIQVLTRAHALRPGYVRAQVNLGKALREAGRPQEALAVLREAADLGADYVPLLINWGDALVAVNDASAAIEPLQRAVRLAPTLIEARCSLGLAQLQAGEPAAALITLREAIELAPSNAEAHSNLAHALLITGDWRAAWPHYEYRLQRATRRVELCIPAGMPRWDGVLSAGLELWLIGEQGLGDQLQFCRYAGWLRAQDVACVLVCDPRLTRLLREADAAMRIEAFGASSKNPNARWFPLMSMPGWAHTGLDDVPMPSGYLRAAPERRARWREYRPGPALPRVALAWAGNPRMETGRHAGRSPPLSALAPLVAIPGYEFISLQKGAGEAQLDTVPFARSITRFGQLDSGPDAFVDTAALLHDIDLLITSDSAIAHLAGALGVRTWLCLPYEADWRWGGSGDHTPWYRSLRLFRQCTPGDWNGLFAEVAGNLAAMGEPYTAGS